MNLIIEKFGIYFSEVGLSKTYGRIFGLFMISNKPLDMNHLIEELQISKSTASTELRRLLIMGVIEKVSLPYKRAVHYQIKNNIWIENLNQKRKSIEQLKDIVTDLTLEEKEAHPHLNEMLNYCEFIEVELKQLTQKYLLRVKEQSEK